MFGNAAMAGLTSIRNRISSGLQRRFVSDRSQRTRETISRRNSAEDAARYQVGLQEYKRINDMLGDAGKYTNELNRIRRHMRAPFNGVLGKAVDFASNTLEAEDIFFSQKDENGKWGRPETTSTPPMSRRALKFSTRYIRT